ncbi:MAG: hypothetical protein CVU00_06750 [Bacteroidetes bacterium HGW-Bacteroidetes-17]|jgi:prolyl-tRNA editing enzyme YbaK/EbsC (Cys-tRNA(Pro) deacylase)|nr:MAG: hypothetical protein CVU00_06750 [Bacteroidetes bacterium HGW-Bacteroidetes-17]
MFEEIKFWLQSQKIEFTIIKHEPTLTSAQSAKARGEDLSIGGKALIMKVGNDFKIFVLSASRKIDSNAIKKRFNVKKLRFVNSDELKELTGLTSGAVPPFGRPFFNLELYVDHSIKNNLKIAFNAASLTNSIIMKTSDYLKIAGAEYFDFSSE